MADVSPITRRLDAYLMGVQHAGELSQRAQEHEDQSLIWALALMGGALLTLPSAIQSLDLHVELTRWGFFLAGLPWSLGIILAVVGGYCYRQLRIVESNFHYEKTTLIRRAFLDDPPKVDMLQSIIDDTAGNLRQHPEGITLWSRWTKWLFYATHGLLLFGFVTIAIFIIWRTWTR